MPFAHLLALASLLQPTGCILVGGDHRQLPCIRVHDSSADLRPSLLRHFPFLTAYEYLVELEARAGA